MSIYAHIKRCLELSDREITSAIADRRLTKALLDQLSKVSKPSDGAPKLLLVFAKMAAQQVEWVDGALRIEMAGDAEVTTVEVLCEMGLGMHERVVPSFKMNVPLEEFIRAVERVPHMIEPLSIVTSSDKRLVLTSSTEEEEDESGDAASSVNVPIADDSLYVRAPSRDKMAAVRPSSAPRARPVRRSSRPEMPAVTPKIISARSGKTLRPAPPVPPAHDAPPPSQRVVPVVPKPPALPGAQAKSPPAPEVKRSAIARVGLTKVQVPRSALGAGAHDKGGVVVRPAASAPKRASKPPGKRMSVKPPATPLKKASKPPASRGASARPPPKSKRGTMSEPPDEESVDQGWDEDS